MKIEQIQLLDRPPRRRLIARYAHGKQDGTKRHRERVYRAELDLETLVWTRGTAFPLARLESSVKCLRCGSRRDRLAFTVPNVPMAARGA